MRANISAWAIKRPIPSIVLFILLTITGVISFLTLSITDTPNIDFPIVNVIVTQQGAAPSELETQVTRVVEDAVASLGGIDHMNSTVTEGVSRTIIQFLIGTNTDRAVNDVRDAISKARENLPQTIDEPQVQRVDASGGDVIAFSVSAPNMSVTELGWFVDNDVTRDLLSIRGVSEVERSGGAEREIRVNLQPERLIALGLTVDDVNRQIRAVNANMPGGRSTIGTSEQSIRALGSVESVDALKRMTIALPNHRTARLVDLGTVEDGFAEPRHAGLLDGKPVVAFFVQRSVGASEVTVAHEVIKKLDALGKAHPNISFHKIFSVAEYDENAYRASMEALMLGAVLAVIVVFVFLRDWRATLIVGVALPLSVFPTFFPMQVMGFTLNFISLLALTLVVGILVDDAIVEIENIVRHMRMGKTPYQAALDAADEIGLAVVATTMTIVAVFLPVSFMGGIAGQYFRQFGATVAVAVLFSLLVARLITPMMAAYFGRDHGPEEHAPRWLGAYLKLLGWALDHRWKASFCAAGFFVVSIGLITLLPTDFIPSEDQSLSSLILELPPGSTLAETTAAMQQVTAVIRKEPEVKSVFISIGGATNGDVRLARATISLVPRADRQRRQQAIEKDLSVKLKSVPGIRYNFNGNGGQDLAVVLTGDDPKTLSAVGDELVRQMGTLPALTNIKTSASLLRPELQIRPLYDRASELGVSVADIGNVARLATLGEINANLAKFDLPDRQIPIRVEIAPDARSDLNQIRNLRVATVMGGTVPLDSVAEITIGSGTSEVKRYNRAREVLIGADLGGAPLGPAGDAVHKLPVLQHLPPGVKLEASGATKEMEDVFGQFGLAFAAGILLVLGVLVLLFQSFLQPITIMGALPLSIGGAIAALLLTGDSMSLSVLIGLLMLMGIVTKNSILFVDYAILAIREHGLARREALIEAGSKRAQPILMTTIAMIAGMLPIAARLGEDADFRAPMAITVIGGLATSTLLSLVFVPVAYTFVDDIQGWLTRRLARLVAPARTSHLPAE
ncbi:MAG TPA: efflux RND transporter permease subunit [Aliidongia sp.]|nr:efflux RND transporter permease subunit [Aliidongia sp.]